MRNNIIVTSTTIFLIFFGMFVYTKLAGPIPFSVNSIQTTKTNLFTATGTGKATAVPNTALVSLGVTKNTTSVLTAQQQVNEIANILIQDLKNLGIAEKDIKTTNYSVYPNYNYNGGRQTTNGYTVSQNLEVRIQPIEKANQAIDIATADGANIVGGISFVLDEKTQKQIEEKARKEAVTKAKEKAQSLASAAGIKLGKIVDVQENAGLPNFPIRMNALQAPGGGEEKQTSITPGESTVEVTITLSYETY